MYIYIYLRGAQWKLEVVVLCSETCRFCRKEKQTKLHLIRFPDSINKLKLKLERGVYLYAESNANTCQIRFPISMNKL